MALASVDNCLAREGALVFVTARLVAVRLLLTAPR
jgi:hypothetical protein